MIRRYLCLQDWEIESGVYYEEGEYYEGIPSSDGSSAEITGEAGMVVTFYRNNEFFHI